MRLSMESIFVIECLREYETIYKTASALESGDPEVLFDENTDGRKSRETVHLRKNFFHEKEL
jgi:hypothetical protein